MNREKFLIDRFKIDTSTPAPYPIKISRWKQLPHLLAEMKCLVGAEVGVEQGKYSDCLLRKIPGLKLYCIDCWEVRRDYRWVKKDHTALYEQKAKKLLEGRASIIKQYSVEAAQRFMDESLDFVYIDGNHNFQNCTNDIAEWSRKVKKGGIIAGHDFAIKNVGYERIDVEAVVRAWTLAHNIKTWFVTSEGDRCPSWLWIKH